MPEGRFLFMLFFTGPLLYLGTYASPPAPFPFPLPLPLLALAEARPCMRLEPGAGEDRRAECSSGVSLPMAEARAAVMTADAYHSTAHHSTAHERCALPPVCGWPS